MERSGSTEGVRPGRLRKKTGLETPLTGRLWRESRLIFGPPPWHDWLVGFCIIGGAVYFGAVFFSFIYYFIPWWVGLAVMGAGLWAAMSTERMTINLKAGTYLRLEGGGMFKTITKGKVSSFDALVLQTEVYPVPTLVGRLAIYRLIIYWKGQREPLLIASRQEHTVGFSGPINAKAAPLIYDGQRFAQLMGIPFYDNSHYESPRPLPPV
jgi:hypothetical protein